MLFELTEREVEAILTLLSLTSGSFKELRTKLKEGLQRYFVQKDRYSTDQTILFNTVKEKEIT